MADKIGVLGETSVAATGVSTPYTVPASKAARVKLMYRIQGAADATTDLTITVNGLVVMSHSNIAASEFLYSSLAALKEGSTSTVPAGDADDTTVAPAPQEYFLAAGDTVTFTLDGTIALAVNFQVVGVEADA